MVIRLCITLAILCPFFFWLFYKASKTIHTKLLLLSESAPFDTRLKFLLDDYNHLESICPEDFIQNIRETNRRLDLWYAVSRSAAAGLFILFIAAKGVQILGWPLHQVIWASLLIVTSIHLVLSIFQSLKSYAHRLDLGSDPLLPKTNLRSQKAMGFFALIGMLWMGLAVPQNDIGQLLTMITGIEAAIICILGLFHKITLTEEGIHHRRKILPWEDVAWYRWYDHREGVLVGIEPSGFRFGCMMILPATEETRTELNEMLEWYSPDKRLEDIETDSQITFEPSRVTAA